MLRATSLTRTIAWRLGRWLYSQARGDGPNDPTRNGEYWLLRSYLSMASGPIVLLDIGANVGNWTERALRYSRGSRSLRVYAFEPAPAARALLEGRFAGHPSVVVKAVALSDVVGRARFYIGEPTAGTNSLSAISGQTTIDVDVLTLDEYLEDEGIPSVGLVKVDTEGFDMNVLRGAGKTLAAGRIEVIQFEYNWRWIVARNSLRDVFQLIEGKPYRLGKLVGRSIEFFDRWHFEMDRFFENNYVLVKADSPVANLGVAVRFDRSNALRISRE